MERLFVGAGIAAGSALGGSGVVDGATGGGFLLLFAGFADERFAGETDLVALDGENFHENLVAELQLIGNVGEALFGDSLMCRRPSVPGKSSTKAPNSAR